MVEGEGVQNEQAVSIYQPQPFNSLIFTVALFDKIIFIRHERIKANTIPQSIFAFVV